MEAFQIPGDPEISAAYAQGEEAVTALFRRTFDRHMAQRRAADEIDAPDRAA